jgi:V8-like Glu-specific endopeptidase
MRHGGSTRGFPGRRLPQPITLAATFITVIAVMVLTLASTVNGTAGLARLASAASELTVHAPKAPPSLRDGRFFTGIPAVGALFAMNGSSLGQHFCTASVVASPRQDLLITAAHCLSTVPAQQMAFVPGYNGGQHPYGIWRVAKVFVDQAWTTGASQDDDVAFLQVQRNRAGTPIQAVTGAEQLGVGWGPVQWVRAIGYPGDQERPLTCQARTSAASSTQMEFDCAGYTNGTSGGPFLTHISPSTGEGTIIGVIGGLQLGGDTAGVSYAAMFGSEVSALYQTAIAHR